MDMKSQAKRAMVKGLMAQLTKRVRATGFGVFPASITFLKSIWSMMGYIMKKRQIAIGMDTLAYWIPFRVSEMAGKARPNPIPAIMQRITQSDRYFPKRSSFLSFAS